MYYQNKKRRMTMLPSRIFFDDVFDDMKIDDKMKCDIYEKDNIYNVEVLKQNLIEVHLL